MCGRQRKLDIILLKLLLFTSEGQSEDANWNVDSCGVSYIESPVSDPVTGNCLGTCPPHLIIIIKFGDIIVFERPTLIHLVIYTVLLMLILNVCLYEWIKAGGESNGVLGYLRRFWDSHSMHFKIHECSRTRGIHHTGGLMGWWLEIERIDLHSSRKNVFLVNFLRRSSRLFLPLLTHEIHFYAV